MSSPSKKATPLMHAEKKQSRIGVLERKRWMDRWDGMFVFWKIAAPRSALSYLWVWVDTFKIQFSAAVMDPLRYFSIEIWI
jgi:hypothetical protein